VQKTMKKVEMFSRANIDWEDEAKIKEVLWERWLDMYRWKFFQTYQDGLDILNQIYDSQWEKWGWRALSSMKAPNLWWFADGLSKMRFAIEDSKWSWYKSWGWFKITPLPPYEADKTRTLRDRQNEKIPKYTAKSESYFKDVQWVASRKDISRKIAQKKITPIKIKWKKKS
jgi:hypothetical protein